MTTSILHRIPLIRHLTARPRLLLAALLALALFAAAPEGWRVVTRFLISWDGGLLFYLLLVASMMARSDEKGMKRRAAQEDAGSHALLALTASGALASLAAIVLELAQAKSSSGHVQLQTILLAGATVVLSWFFLQTMFALHYAHAYYNNIKRGGDGGLEFPARFDKPDYWDFVYFSFVIGTAAATADINLTSRTMRRIVTLQCVLVFFYNTTILALAINVGASLAT